MTKAMVPHFKKLFGEISMYAMDTLIKEQCLPVAGEGTPERAVLQALLESNDMDERHLMCAKYLGYTTWSWPSKPGSRRKALSEKNSPRT